MQFILYKTLYLFSVLALLVVEADFQALKASYVRWFQDLRSKDVAEVGGKNSSLGEMISQLTQSGIPVPNGFATTAKAYWDHIEGAGLKELIKSELELFDAGEKEFADVGRTIRKAVSSSPLPPALEASIC